MTKRRTVLLASLAAVMIVAAAAAFFVGARNGAATANAETADAGESEQGPPPAPVQVAKTTTAKLAPQAEAPGSIVSLHDGLIAAATSGKIIWVAEVGAEVEEGDVIARIDPSDAQLARDEGISEIASLKARAEYLARLYARYESLGEESGESEASLDEMRVNRDEARQRLVQAELALRRAEINLERAVVKAPYPGRIASQEIQVGEYATNGAPVARLVDTGHLEVTAQAPGSLVRNISPGDHVTVVNKGDSISAPVRAIVPVGDQVSRTMELRIALPDTSWFIGSAVRVSLPSAAPREVVAAPRDALVLRANRVSVFVIDEGDTAKRVDVSLGSADGDLIEVIGDISAGDKVVVRGGERLRDGQTVTVSNLVDGVGA